MNSTDKRLLALQNVCADDLIRHLELFKKSKSIRQRHKLCSEVVQWANDLKRVVDHLPIPPLPSREQRNECINYPKTNESI